MHLLASIPSPSSNRIGPFTAYGLMIALGVVAAVWLCRARWAKRGGDPDDISTIALWAVPGGLIGARIYHVVTDNQLYRGHWLDNPFASGAQSPLAVWNGGLGIPGGIIGGVLVGMWIARRLGVRLPPIFDAAAPCIPLAQAIGRLGNWFNQEIFGGPTDLPWGLEIDVSHRPRAFADVATFHPTFLYEGLWNLGIVGLLLLVDRRRVLRPGRLFALYVGGYFTGRLWVESLRIDDANTILGLRLNIWTSLVAIVGVLTFLAIGGVRRRDGDSDAPYTEEREGIARADQSGPNETPPEEAKPVGP